MQKKFVVVAVLLVAMLQSLQLHAAARASCHDPDGPGGRAGEWYASYSVGGSDRRHVNFHELGFRPYAGWNLFFAAAPDAPWQVSVRPLTRAGLEMQQGTTQQLLAGGIEARFRRIDLYPQLLTPNRHCTLFLRSYDYLAASDAKPRGLRVAIVGDSLTQAFAASQSARRELAREFARHDWQMEFSALGGLAWQRAPQEPEGSNLHDEIRGLLTTRPDIFVFALGTNDALINAKARLKNANATPKQERRHAVAQIAQTLQEVDAYAPAMCKILVTPSTHPYFLVMEYIDEAIFIGDVLRFFAGQPTQTDISAYVKGLKPITNARVADWATVSANAQMAALMPDGIHMNEEGSAHFRTLWMREIAACEARRGTVSRRDGAR